MRNLGFHRRAVIALCISFTSFESAFADGPFDPTFAHGGVYFYAPAEYSVPAGIAQDAQGRLLVATTLGKQLAVTRHTSDGSLDMTFGNRGVASDFIYVGPDDQAWATSIVSDHQGHMILGGKFEGTEPCAGGGTGLVNNYLVVRLSNVPGAESVPDNSFGIFGVGAYGDCSHAVDDLAGLAVGADDSVFGVGTSLGASNEATVVRWNSDGQIANEFGTDGATSYRNTAAEETEGTSIAIDSKGRLLVTTQSYKSSAQSGALVRFTSRGELDSAFASGGVFDFGSLSPYIWDHIGDLCCVRVDHKDRLVVAGLSVSKRSDGTAETHAFVARLTENGIPDETFGQHGFSFIGNGEFNSINALSVDARDRPVVLGALKSPYSAVPADTVVQLNADGTANAAVGFGGFFGAELGFDSSPTSMLVGGDGRIVMGAAQYAFHSTLIRYDQIFGDGLD